MKPLKGFILLWGVLILFLLVIPFFYDNFSITGNVPLTGVLKEEPGREIVVQDFNISFNLRDSVYYKIRDVSFDLEFIPRFEGGSYVELDYLVVDEQGDLIYFESESIFVEGDMIYSKDLDNREAQEMEVPEGNYVFSVVARYGDSQKTFSEEFRVEKISKLLYSLKQLFDIKFELDSRVVDSAEELSGRVVFENFGEVTTPINLTFFIYDMNDNELYEKKLFRVVETEDVVFEDFEGFEAPPGEYVVVLRTLYNVGVEDYFEQSFQIRDKVSVWPFVVLAFLFLVGVYFAVKRK